MASSAPPVERSLLLAPNIAFCAERQINGSWIVAIGGIRASGLESWRALEAFIWEMVDE